MKSTITKALLTLLFLSLAPTAWAQDGSDFGLWFDAGIEKKLGKKWSVGADLGYRSRSDARITDRMSLGLAAEYKFTKWLKAGVGYDLLYDHREPKVTYHKKSGTVNKITPDYWGLRHRFHFDLAGDVDWGRFNFSLRERYQYTYRPVAKAKKYDTDTEEWEDVKAKNSHLLRSRLQVEYNIRHCPVDPFASVELFNGEGGLQKTRYTGGLEWKITKQHSLKAYYRYQTTHDDDDDEPNRHVVGLGYGFKF